MTLPPDTKPAVSASSPLALAPAVQSGSRQLFIPVEPSSSAASPGPLTPSSLTTKEWVIPPRPKPGRKPATDNPPTKRKAQNRAAQRAFRERRSARVGELEKHIKKIEDEDEQEQTALREQIAELNGKLELCRGEVGVWLNRCHTLEKELAVEKSAREGVLRDLMALQTRASDAVPLARRATRNNKVIALAPEAEEAPLGCGGCSSTSHCECIEAALDMSNVEDQGAESNSKRPHSPSQRGTEKRIKTEPGDEAFMEVDFTHTFSKAQHQSRQGSTHSQNAVSPASVVADPCGFCQDGTPCICAEMAAAENRDVVERARNAITRLPTIRQLSQFTPPPSDGDVSIPLQRRPATTTSSSCVTGPGTCAQCLADPNSTLFCKTLGATREQSQSVGTTAPSGCCGGQSNDQTCCQSRTLPPLTQRTRSRPRAQADLQRDPQTPTVSITLSCADAYTTLSRHPNYERAITSGDVGSWMPKLYPTSARSRDDFDESRGQLATMESKGAVDRDTGRPAMEIEVANVMSVLRDFDRRFGSSA